MNEGQEPKQPWKDADEGIGCFFLSLAITVMILTIKFTCNR